MRTILVSGASGVVGYGILRSLRAFDKSLRLVGTTIYEDSPAQSFCDIFEKAPPTASDGYLDWLLRIIATHEIDLIIPGIEADVYRWVQSVDEIVRAHPVKVLLNEPRLIALCRDKWIFYEALVRARLSCAIDTTLDPNFDQLAERFGLPFLLKPRIGFGAKGIVKVDSLATFQKHRSEVGSILMAQPIVGSDDEEFTTSAFCDGVGAYSARMTLKRKLSSSGFSDRAEVVHLEAIDELLGQLCALFRPVGPTNFQFRQQNGVLKLLEINPRVSSATSIRTAFGYNESQMAVEYYLDGKIPQQPVIRSGRAVRYVEDLIFYT